MSADFAALPNEWHEVLGEFEVRRPRPAEHHSAQNIRSARVCAAHSRGRLQPAVSPHGCATDAAPRQVIPHEAHEVGHENDADLVLFVSFGEAAAEVGSASLTGRAWKTPAAAAAFSLPPTSKAVGLALY